MRKRKFLPQREKDKNTEASAEKEKIIEDDDSNMEHLEKFNQLWDIKKKMLQNLDETIRAKEDLIKNMNKNLEDINGIVEELENIHKQKQIIANEIQTAKKKIVATEDTLFRKALSTKLDQITQENGEEETIILPIKDIKKASRAQMPIIMAMFLLLTTKIDAAMGMEFKPVNEETTWFNLTPQ